GQDLPRSAQQRRPQVLQAIQYIFQNPYTALNPRKTIGQITERPLHHFYPSLSRSERDERVTRVLSDVALGSDFWSRYPDQLSGGERQQVAIARALVVSPDVLVCDGMSSDLEVAVHARIVALLGGAEPERNLSLL